MKKDAAIIALSERKGGYRLKTLSADLRADPEVVKAAVGTHGEALQFADEKLKAHPEVVIVAVQKNGLSLQYADEKLRADPEVVKAAVEQNGLALQYADKTLMADPEIARAAVEENALAMQYTSNETVRSDRGLVWDAITDGDCWVLRYASDELRSDRGLVTYAFRQYSKWTSNTSDGSTIKEFLNELVPEDLMPELVIDYLSDEEIGIEEKLNLVSGIPEDVLVQDKVFELAERVPIENYIVELDQKRIELSGGDLRGIEEDIEDLKSRDLPGFMHYFYERYGRGWDEVDVEEKERIIPRALYSAFERRYKKEWPIHKRLGEHIKNFFG